MRPNPQEGEGERNFDCSQYADCENRAAREDWIDFHCEDCPRAGLEDEKDLSDETDKEKTIMKPQEPKPRQDLCEVCGVKPRLKTVPYCGSCMAKRGAAKRAQEKALGGAQERKNKVGRPRGRPRHKAEPEGPPPAQETALTVDFRKYPGLLNEVRKLADDEIRSPDQQVIYIVKSHFEARREAGGGQ